MGKPAVILVVEDEHTIAEAVVSRLRAEGFEVAVASDGPSGVAQAGLLRPDLIVLDVMLPGYDGLEVCRRVQAARPVPVLMLTARDDETDILVGLGVGADDYLTKPFSMRELVARVRVLLRRVERAAEIAVERAGELAADTVLADRLLGVDRPMDLDGLSISVDQRRVSRNGADVHLTPTEFDLLVCLAERPRTVLTREHLLAEVWGWQDASGTRTVDSHVRSLRRKLGAETVRTVHGVGYALELGV